MTRSRTSILFGVALAGLVLALPAGARAASVGETVSSAGTKLTAQEFSAQSRKVLRRARRVPVYGGSTSRTPGPNSVRVCTDWYEQEYRPSGTVIVPRMRCYWSG